MDDKELIHRIQKGQKELLNTVIERYYSDICRYCVYLTGNTQDAYDLTQETFLKFIRYVDTYRYRNLKAYLFMIARNLCMDHFRRQKHETVLDAGEETGACDVRLEEAETRSWLYMELQKLPQAQREAIVLFYYGELKIREIASVTGAKLSTVKSRIRQGTARLKEIMVSDGKGA